MGDPEQGWKRGADGLDLPPGFRFHPFDEEIITSYLRPKVLDNNFTALAIGEVDLNKLEPWELPLMENMGEKVGYFYYQRGRKYPTGPRANRATEAGYWKATSKDRNIYQGAYMGPMPLGMKKTLVFYKGRAPKGGKTNWVMHEYRLPYHEEWVVCKVSHKCSDIKKAPEFTPALVPFYDMTMSTDNTVDLSGMRFPMLTQFPMELEDFTIDLSTSFYSTGGTSLVSTELSPMIDNKQCWALDEFQSLWAHDFYDTTNAVLPEQVGIGTSSNCSFMPEPDSMPTSMLSHDIRASSDLISLVASIEPMANWRSISGMDSIWKY